VKRKVFEVDKLAALLEKKEKSEEILGKMEKSGVKEVALTDPDCRQMMNHGRVESCYNMQAAVDSKNHLIVNYLVTNEASDLNQLSGVAINAKETLGVEQIDCLSDKGYFDFMQIKQCVDNGVTPYVAVKKSGTGGSLVSSSLLLTNSFMIRVLICMFVQPGSVFSFTIQLFVKGWIGAFTSA
jgi:Transposase DDE domain